MQLFLTLNDLAGRYPVLDALMRGVYVGTVPLLAVILLGLVTLAPRGKGSPSRGKVALAAALALGGAALLAWGIETLAQSLDLGTISPRPFMTRWVNLLIVEPQDNSFPCLEVMVAAILSAGIWAAHRGWGVFAALATLLLMTARLFCGSNYAADVGVGAVLGIGLMLLCLAICRAPRAKNARVGLASTGVLALGGAALCTFIVMAGMPRFAGKLQLPWGIAAPVNAAAGIGAPAAARSTLQEGEGMATLGIGGDGTISADQYAGEAESQALSKRSTLFLPKTEAFLTQVLTPKALPFRLLDVEVAPVNFKEKSYRAAALRFEIDPKLPGARRLVAQRAATLVKSAFAADPKLDNVDITGVVTGNAAKLDDSLMHFAGDEIPVFTASIQRRNLIVSAPKWANDPNLEGGLWLRTRSRLWINEKVLPKTPAPTAPTLTTPASTATPKPTAAPTPTAMPNVALTATPKPKVRATPTVAPTVKPTAKPTKIPSAMAKPIVKPTPGPKPKPPSKPRPITRPAAEPAARPRVQPGGRGLFPSADGAGLAPSSKL